MLKRIAIFGSLGALAAGGFLFVTARHLLLASLPRLDGEASLPGLSAPVSVERDGVGVVRLEGETLLDLARAQGFIHAQDRFFQMDLFRKRAAGELARVAGPPLLRMDRRMRIYDFRRRSEMVFANLPQKHRTLLEAYADGVNAGLADLGGAPPEHLALQIEVETWEPADSLLVLFHMFDGLSWSLGAERQKGVMVDALPPELVAFLTPSRTRWDVPIWRPDAEATPEPPIPTYPGPDVVNLRADDVFPTLPGAQNTRSGGGAPDDTLEDVAPPGAATPPPGATGSNSWAVAGSRTRDGRAILANDMHLGLLVPNTWHRMQLEWNARRAAGLTLPGVPSVIVGSNGRLAWGFTNHYNDSQDLIVVEVDPADPDKYLTGDPEQPSEAFGERVETIRVRGRAAETLTIRTTRWGDVLEEDHRGRPVVLKWTAFLPEGVDLGLFDMLETETLEEGVEVMRAWRGPSQNALLASDDGRIAWVPTGWLPRRVGFDGSVPVAWSDPAVGGWQGQIEGRDRLEVIDPAEGILYTANNRTSAEPAGSRLGAEWPPPDRAARIRKRLLERDDHDETSVFDVALDTRADRLDFYQALLRDLEATGSDADAVERAQRLAASWRGTADADERGYRAVKAFRSEVHEAIFGALTAPCRRVDPGYSYEWLGAEEPARRILEARPAHLLPRPHETWDDLFRAAAVEAIARLEASGAPIDARWGSVNESMIQHPVSMGIPALGRVLDMPRREQSGDMGVVKVSGPRYGASQRMSVSPGREEEGFAHMPAGQAGHFLARHYSAGHEAWAEGRPLPMLAGEAEHTLTLIPK